MNKYSNIILELFSTGHWFMDNNYSMQKISMSLINTAYYIISERQMQKVILFKICCYVHDCKLHYNFLLRLNPNGINQKTAADDNRNNEHICHVSAEMKVGTKYVKFTRFFPIKFAFWHRLFQWEQIAIQIRIEKQTSVSI